MNNNNNNNNKAEGGTGFFGLLTIAFIILKLTRYIDWSWWWVLCPLWIPIALLILVGLWFLIKYRPK
jgi:uncharacterized protein (DUF983 family)